MVMIEKQAKGAGRDPRRYVRSLANYMETAKRGAMAEEYGLTLASYISKNLTRELADAHPERVLATGGRINGNAALWDLALAELHARMDKRSSRSKKPAHHIVASVQAGENPNPDDCDEIARVLANELGCEEGVILWALHGDTDHRHLHILVLTLRADGTATPFGPKGRSHEAMQRTMARIEHGRGFASEPGARYEVVGDDVKRKTPTATPDKRRPPIRTEVLQWEARTGLESFTRYAQNELAPLLDTAVSWDEAQAALAPKGAVIMKAGSGGKLCNDDGSQRVTLSNVDRTLSWSKLTDRWGEWPEPTIEPTPYVPRILDPARATLWSQRDQQTEPIHNGVQARIDRIRAERRVALDRIGREHAANRSHLSERRGEPRDIARLREGLNTLYRRRAAAVDVDYRSRIAALGDLRGEIADAESLDDVDLEEIAAPDCSLEIAWGSRPTEPSQLEGFLAVKVGEAVQYWREGESRRAPAFVERGDRIWVNDRSDNSVRAALLLAQSRYGVIAAWGEAAFIAQACRIGKELGIEVQVGRGIGGATATVSVTAHSAATRRGQAVVGRGSGARASS